MFAVKLTLLAGFTENNEAKRYLKRQSPLYKFIKQAIWGCYFYPQFDA